MHAATSHRFSTTNNGYIHTLNCSRGTDILKRDVNVNSINTNLLVTCSDAVVQKRLIINKLVAELKKIENIEKLVVSSFLQGEEEGNENGDVATFELNIENLALESNPVIPYDYLFLQSGSGNPEPDVSIFHHMLTCFSKPVYLYKSSLLTITEQMQGATPLFDVYSLPMNITELRADIYVYPKSASIAEAHTNVGDLVMKLCDDKGQPFEHEIIEYGHIGDNTVAKNTTARFVLKTALPPYTPFSISHQTTQNGYFYIRIIYYMKVY